jgi:phytanoyl-CoA hydroxylase
MTSLDQFKEKGYFLLEGLFSPRECEGLKQESTRILAEHSPGRTVFVGCSTVSLVFKKLASDPRIIEPLKAIYPQGIEFLSDKFVYKSGQKRFATPWHTDEQYWRNTKPKLSVWIALDRAEESNGALKILPGSHHKAWKEMAADTSTTNGEFDATVDSSQWKPSDEMVCEVAQGSALVFTDRLLHASCPNVSGLDRYSLISTYQGLGPEEPFDQEFTARHLVWKP